MRARSPLPRRGGMGSAPTACCSRRSRPTSDRCWPSFVPSRASTPTRSQRSEPADTPSASRPSAAPPPCSRHTSRSSRVQIALFVTCIGDTVFPEAGRATVRVLERRGDEVVFPAEQTCCGQMHVNSGYRHEGLGLARRFVEIFGEYDVGVSPSSSCGGNVRELYPQLAHEANDAKLAHAVDSLAPRVFELSELLVSHLGLSDVGASFPHRVAYHPTCHSLRVTNVGEAPL